MGLIVYNKITRNLNYGTYGFERVKESFVEKKEKNSDFFKQKNLKITSISIKRFCEKKYYGKKKSTKINLEYQ